LELDEVQVTTTWALLGDPLTPVGASGIENGVWAAEIDDGSPLPHVFAAATRKTYVVPFVRLVTVADVDVDVPSAYVDHVDPELVEYWIT
jgi:hypothetical protein